MTRVNRFTLAERQEGFKGFRVTGEDQPQKLLGFLQKRTPAIPGKCNDSCKRVFLVNGGASLG
jgi:hypothetical protein